MIARVSVELPQTLGEPLVGYARTSTLEQKIGGGEPEAEGRAEVDWRGFKYCWRAKCNVIRFSEAFPNAQALLAECARLGLEGIVAKRKDSPYRSGTRSGWIKVKTSEWRRTSGGRKTGAELKE
jgi:hypothetical protein